MHGVLRSLLLCIWCIPAFFASAAVAQDTLRIGVASSFTPALKALSKAYTVRTGVILRLSSASTGKLYQQAVYGAPYDLLLAADSDHPARLVQEQHAVADSLITYAIGRLVLAYREDMETTDTLTVEALLTQPRLTLAVANPEFAPYGRAGIEVLKRFGSVNQRRLLAVSAAQALQMLVAGGADLALVASAQRPIFALDLPADWYTPIVQQAVLLNNARQPELARRFLHWLQGPEATAIIQQHGYALPDRV
ncbi:MAG: molybdate ABC transporter substrate-binding protein [Pseudomonadota bacterium]